MTEVKDGLKYTKEHEWAKIEGDIATVGITDYAQNALTDIVFVELPEEGKEVSQSKSFATLESVKSVSDVYAALSGKIIEVNKELENSPDLINKEPYEGGWIAKIKMSDLKEADSLMDAESYKQYLEKEGH